MAHIRGRLGSIGEGIAGRHLERLGFTVIERNWRCAEGPVRGEVDLIAWDGPVLVFCEVKTRRAARVGVPLEGVTPAKATRLRRLAAAYLATTGVRVGEVRFDAVGVSWPPEGGAVEVVHVAGAC
jgi:putative endonuclease